MASKSDISAGRAFVEIYVKNSAFMKGLSQVQQHLKTLASGLKQFGEEVGKIGRAITFVGIAIGGALIAGISKVVAKTPELKGVADAFDASRKAVEELFVQIATALAPSLIELANKFTVAVKRLAEFVSTHRDLIVDLAKGLVLFTGIGIAIVAAGKAFALVGTAISVANTLITVSTTVATAAVWALNAAFVFLSSPIVLITGAVVAVGGALLYFSGAFTGTAGLIKQSVGDMASTVLSAFGGIKDALMSGDFSLAASIAWLGIKTVFQQGINLVLNLWDQFITNLQNMWTRFNLMVTEALLGTAGFITRQIQRIINALNRIPGVNIGTNLEFDSKSAIQNARENAAASIQEREARTSERKRDRESLVTGLARELAGEIEKARKKTEGAKLPPGIVDPRQLRASDRKKMEEAAIDSRRTEAFGTFYAGSINQAIGATRKSELDKIAKINQEMLKELRRIVFEFTA